MKQSFKTTKNLRIFGNCYSLYCKGENYKNVDVSIEKHSLTNTKLVFIISIIKNSKINIGARH